jgi:hypothetical protein
MPLRDRSSSRSAASAGEGQGAACQASTTACRYTPSLRSVIEGDAKDIERVQDPVDHPRPARVEAHEGARQLEEVLAEVVDVQVLLELWPRHAK